MNQLNNFVFLFVSIFYSSKNAQLFFLQNLKLSIKKSNGPGTSTSIEYFANFIYLRKYTNLLKKFKNNNQGKIIKLLPVQT